MSKTPQDFPAARWPDDAANVDWAKVTTADLVRAYRRGSREAGDEAHRRGLWITPDAWGWN